MPVVRVRYAIAFDLVVESHMFGLRAAQRVSRSSSSGASRSTDLSNGATPKARLQSGGAELAIRHEDITAAPADRRLRTKRGDESMSVV